MKISTKSLIVGGVLVTSGLVLAGCGNQQQATQTSREMMREGQEMAEAVRSGQPTYCKVAMDDGSGTMEYWMKNGKMKAMGKGVASAQEGGSEVGAMINDGVYMYIWSEGETTGVKMKVPTEEEVKEAQADAEAFAKNMPDFEDQTTIDEYEAKGYQVNCKQMNISDNEFVPPAEITFQDFEAMMEEGFKEMKQNMEMMGQEEMMKQLPK